MVYGFPERCKWSAACHHCIRFHTGIGRHFCLGYLRALTRSLQAETEYVVPAVGDIDVVLTSLKEEGNSYTIDQQHDAWLQEIELMCRVSCLIVSPLETPLLWNENRVPCIVIILAIFGPLDNT